METEKIDLSGLEFCPTCGHKLKKQKTVTEAAQKASRENGKKFGGRPVNPNSKRQQMLRAKAEKEKAK